MTFTGRMAVNGTTEVISLDRNTDYDVEITKVNKTVIMYRWIMRFDDGSQITLDEQPIFRHESLIL